MQSEKVKRANGRPHYLFSLTLKGDEMFPRRFDVLAAALLEEVGALRAADLEDLDPDGKRSLMVQRAADRLAERYRFPIDGRSLPERIQALTSVLHAIGGFAEWVETESGFEVRDYNCVFASLASQGDGCPGHLRLITQLLQWPARHEIFDDGRVHCCRYIVSPQPDEALEGLLLNA